MSKKIQRKPIKHTPVSLVTSQDAKNNFSFQEALTVFGGLTGLVVAILWQGGRFYISGYYKAMNISPFQISYSIWEYAEYSWFRLIVYFLAKVSLPFLVIILGSSFLIFLTLFLERLLPQLKLATAIEQILSLSKNVWRHTKAIFIAIFLIIVISFLASSFADLSNLGRLDGQRYVLLQSREVQIYSKEALPLESSATNKNSLSNLFYYTDLRLLTNNNGKYYLFRDINLETCKPKQVFVIKDTEDIYIVLGDIVAFDNSCSENFKDEFVPLFTP